MDNPRVVSLLAFLAAKGGRQESGFRILHVQHDSGCPLLDGGECDCEPTFEYHTLKELPEAA